MNKFLPLFKPVRIAMVALLLVVIVITQFWSNYSSANIEDVTEKVIQSINMDNMEENTSRYLKKLYGLNANDYEGISLYTPKTNMDAEELLIIKLKDDEQAEEVLKAIETRLNTQKTSFEGYGIAQYDLLEHSILNVHGNFILFVVHSDADKADQTFVDNL